MTLFVDIVKVYAVFFDSKGLPIGKKRIDTTEQTFNFQKKSYFYRANCLSFFYFNGMIFKYKFYFYNEDNPEPLELYQDYQPLMTAKQFGIIINTKKLEELNDLANEGGFLEGLLKLLKNPIFWILLVVGIGFFIWFSKKGFKF